MKLYATTTSERATKGQGGNMLEIIITAEIDHEYVKIGEIDVHTQKDGNYYFYATSTSLGEYENQCLEVVIPSTTKVKK